MHLDPQLLDLAGHDSIHHELDVLLGRDSALDLLGQVLGEWLGDLGIDPVLDQMTGEAGGVHALCP